MPNTKKSQSMPFSIIIIAVILIIVLIIVVGVFRGNFFQATKDLQSCGVRGGDCKPGSCDSSTQKELEGAECINQETKNPDSNIKCCITIVAKK